MAQISHPELIRTFSTSTPYVDFDRRATAWDLCLKGYTVVLACRDVQAAQAEKQRIIEATGGSPVVVGPLDLASMSSIEEFATSFNRAHSRLDILVNNAGCNFISDWRTDQGVPGLVQAYRF